MNLGEARADPAGVVVVAWFSVLQYSPTLIRFSSQSLIAHSGHSFVQASPDRPDRPIKFHSAGDRVAFLSVVVELAVCISAEYHVHKAGVVSLSKGGGIFRLLV